MLVLKLKDGQFAWDHAQQNPDPVVVDLGKKPGQTQPSGFDADRVRFEIGNQTRGWVSGSIYVKLPIALQYQPTHSMSTPIFSLSEWWKKGAAASGGCGLQCRWRRWKM